ncbi:APM1-AP-1 complex subunit mu1 subunit [Fusarium albosuccineum]|uniref:APM1-AP-1 complex subunit mu1 subunit n=1 Tax=Fusarium albosuccineum TaxID=1237068 RepID=A0A8H4L2I5_9HYPO|nr:APM1-AP-1 complex subunit mu1 subunit [Fusarium albosuccineum]
MNGVIEALHIYDDNRNPILSHTYAGRPLSATHLLPLYLEHPAPRPNLIYLSNTSPPTLVFSLTHANLLFLVTSSTEIEPLLVFEFLHRVIDAFEDFLGAPLLAVKIENSYDIVAQLLTEMCDAGTISTTEPNALREVVEQEGWVGKLLGSINLPGKAPLSTNFQNSSAPSIIPSNTPALPWRRANVRHTSNEMYADVVETLSVTLAPSGRPLAAFANGTIAFTSKVSGVPDITLTLTSPSGKHNLGGIMELPVFHPCVRLNRWKERPGELSFIPPDGRFILAGYEVDLLPFTSGKSGSLSSNNLKLPVNMEVKAGLGATGSDFEVRLQVNKVLGAPSPSSSGQFGRGGGGGRLGGPHPGSPGAPLIDDLTVTIPLPADVRNLSEIRPSKGDASFNPGEKFLEWHIPAKELSGGTCYFGLRCTVVGPLVGEDEDGFDPNGFGTGTDYTFDVPYQSVPVAKTAEKKESTSDDREAKKVAQNKILMPTSASVSFSVKGWLASGLKVESIQIDTRKSRGLGESVKPYKGVKYLTVSKGGVEIRC